MTFYEFTSKGKRLMVNPQYLVAAMEGTIYVEGGAEFAIDEDLRNVWMQITGWRPSHTEAASARLKREREAEGA